MGDSWKNNTFTYDWLRRQSLSSNNEGSILFWLKGVGVIPPNVQWKRGNRTVNTNLNPDAIKAETLAEIAYDFDGDGGGTPRQFVDVLAYEVSGTPEKLLVGEIMANLGGPV